MIIDSSQVEFFFEKSELNDVIDVKTTLVKDVNTAYILTNDNLIYYYYLDDKEIYDDLNLYQNPDKQSSFKIRQIFPIHLYRKDIFIEQLQEWVYKDSYLILCLDEQGKLYVHFKLDNKYPTGYEHIDNFNVFIPATTINKYIQYIYKIEYLHGRNYDYDSFAIKIFDQDQNIYLLDISRFYNNYKSMMKNDNLYDMETFKREHLLFLFDNDNPLTSDTFESGYPYRLIVNIYGDLDLSFKQIDIIDERILIALDQNNVLHYTKYDNEIYDFSDRITWLLQKSDKFSINRTINVFPNDSFKVSKNDFRKTVADFKWFSNNQGKDSQVIIEWKIKNDIEVPYEYYLLWLLQNKIISEKIQKEQIIFNVMGSKNVYVTYLKR